VCVLCSVSCATPPPFPAADASRDPFQYLQQCLAGAGTVIDADGVRAAAKWANSGQAAATLAANPSRPSGGGGGGTNGGRRRRQRKWKRQLRLVGRVVSSEEARGVLTAVCCAWRQKEHREKDAAQRSAEAAKTEAACAALLRHIREKGEELPSPDGPGAGCDTIPLQDWVYGERAPKQRCFRVTAAPDHLVMLTDDTNRRSFGCVLCWDFEPGGDCRVAPRVLLYVPGLGLRRESADQVKVLLFKANSLIARASAAVVAAVAHLLGPAGHACDCQCRAGPPDRPPAVVASLWQRHATIRLHAGVGVFCDPAVSGALNRLWLCSGAMRQRAFELLWLFVSRLAAATFASASRVGVPGAVQAAAQEWGQHQSRLRTVAKRAFAYSVACLVQGAKRPDSPFLPSTIAHGAWTQATQVVCTLHIPPWPAACPTLRRACAVHAPFRGFVFDTHAFQGTHTRS
jgi:hypothetical protein